MVSALMISSFNQRLSWRLKVSVARIVIRFRFQCPTALGAGSAVVRKMGRPPAAGQNHD
jgi:hypothetical protein